MYRFFTSFVLVLMTLNSIMSQAQSSIYTGGTATISGKLLHYTTDEYPDLTVRFSIVSTGSQTQIEKEVWPDEDGSFKYTLEDGFDYQQVWLIVGDLYFGELIVRNDIFVEVDLKPLSKGKDGHFHTRHVHFSGSDGPLTTYLNKYTDFRQQHPKDVSGQKIPIMMDRQKAPAVKVDTLRKIHEQMMDLVARFTKKHPSPFADVIVNELQSEFYGSLCVIYWGKEMPESLVEEIVAFDPLAISNSGMDYFRYLSA